jgi:hypothetical protein
LRSDFHRKFMDRYIKWFVFGVVWIVESQLGNTGNSFFLRVFDPLYQGLF